MNLKYLPLIFLFVSSPLFANKDKGEAVENSGNIQEEKTEDIKEKKEKKDVKEKKEKKDKKEKGEKKKGKKKKDKKCKKDKTCKKDKKKKDKVKIKGTVEAGFDINHKVNSKETEYKRIGKAKINISARPTEKVRAEFGLEYNKKDSAVTIDKLYGQYGISDFGAVRAGYMKKSFGMEEKAGIDERYFHKRSIVNEGLEDLGFLDHDLTLQYRHNFGKELKLAGGFSWIDTLRYLQNYSIEYENENNHLALSAIIRHSRSGGYRILKNARTTFATALSYKRSVKLHVSEVELTYGTNSKIMAWENKTAHVFGARVQEYFPIEIPTQILRQVIPIAEAALFSDDMGEKTYEAQLRAGLTLGFAKKSAFQWRNVYGTISRFTDISGKSKRELRRQRFDSEVVVAF